MTYFVFSYLPFLLVVFCDPLMLDNGRVRYNKSKNLNGKYPLGTVASFTCNHGYLVEGPGPRTCQISGSLDLKPTTCQCNVTRYNNVYHPHNTDIFKV